MEDLTINFNFGQSALGVRLTPQELAHLHDMPRDYHHIPRHDLIKRIQYVPSSENSPLVVLDVGCNTGATGQAIREKFPNAYVVGVEPHVPSAEIAKLHLNKVIIATSDVIDWSAYGVHEESVDIVLLPDVLEHMYNPWQELLKFKKLLKPNSGRILASIPNARYLPLLHELASGYFPYARSGTLDATHIRFFTKQSVMDLFGGLGFHVDECAHVILPFIQKILDPKDQRADVRTSALLLPQQTLAQRAELGTIQFIIEASVRVV